MHMNSAPHLLAEDRPEFERALDQALRSADRDPEISALIAAVGQRLNTEQLRTMALGAMAAISACAMAEYRTYVRAREEQRSHSTAVQPQPVVAGGSARGADGERTSGTADSPAAAAEGAGAGAVLAVLAPVLAGIAALLFLVIGYVLRLTAAHDSVGGPMVTVGWWFAGLTAASALVAMAALLITALRNGSGAGPGAGAEGRGHHRPTEVDLARDAWREALLERGILPFLREALANAPSSNGGSHVPRPRESNGRTPHLGYSRPGFTSPDFGGGSSSSEERRE
ncbi:hypothetical protein ACIHFE_14960 [Streptomyces sp. NPDC052396]|uniref:hypothetical protein n=1 Tax=Streptomyces sp. NPDC052396 TaxID=3365689 RepID=UPI0037D8BDBA